MRLVAKMLGVESLSAKLQSAPAHSMHLDGQDERHHEPEKQLGIGGKPFTKPEE